LLTRSRQHEGLLIDHVKALPLLASRRERSSISLTRSRDQMLATG
jgi:hypothetical protein